MKKPNPGAIPPTRRTIVESLQSRAGLGGLGCFKDLGPWARWLVFLKALYGLDLSPEERRLFTHHTARAEPRAGGYPEAVVIVGRQSGKSRIAAAIAAYEAVNAPPDETERYAVLVAQDERSAVRVLLSYLKAPFRLPLWRPIVKAMFRDRVDLVHRISAAAYPCRPEALRGPIAVVGVVDELAFMLSTEGRPVDREVLRALRPSLATTRGKLVILSSPYSQTGALFDLYATHWGSDGSTLIWQATAPEMNPTLPADYLQKMEADDVEAYQSEVLGRFRAGLSALFDPVALDRVTDHGTRERGPRPDVLYFPFFDASSGRHDAAALTIWCVADDGRVVQCLARRWPAPHSPEAVRSEVAALLRVYNCPEVYGDLYAIGLQEDGFRGYGITYARSHADASTLALTALSLVNSGRCLLLDLPEQRRELIGLERRRGTSGRDRVGHSRIPDDLAVACCGGMVLAAEMSPSEFAPAYQVTAAERAQMDAFARWAGTPIEGEVIDHEAGYHLEDHDMTWSRNGRPLW